MKNTFGFGRGFGGQRVALGMQSDAYERENGSLDNSQPSDWFVTNEPDMSRLPPGTGVIRAFYSSENKARFFVLTGPGFPILAEGELPPVYALSRAPFSPGAPCAGPVEPTAEPPEPRPAHPKPFIIAVDFDQTLATGPFPEVGKALPMAFEYLRIFQARGARLILLTMRSDGRKYVNDLDANPLRHAVELCRAQGVEFWAVNDNPEQHDWTGSRKVYAHLYIDDAAFGCPLVRLPDARRPVVDWAKVGPGVVKLLDEHNARHS